MIDAMLKPSYSAMAPLFMGVAKLERTNHEGSLDIQRRYCSEGH